MKQIEKFMNAMVIDYAHAATGNRVKWAFTSDTRADVVEMAVAVYRKSARRPYMVIFPQYNAIRNEINTVAAVILEGDDARNIMEGIENVNAFKVTGSPYDNDGMSIYAPAVEQEQEQEAPAETVTEEATPATEATEKSTTTAATAAAILLETLAAKLDRMNAAETARTWAALTGPAYDGEVGTVDAATDDAIYKALQTIDPAAYWKWQNMPTPIDSAYSDSPERHAHMAEIEAEDTRNLFAAYGVTA